MHDEKYRPLAQMLVDFFYPQVEATLFNAKGDLIEVFNPFSSLREDQTADLPALKKGGASHEVLAGGAQVKQMIHAFHDQSGYLRLRYDTSKLHQLKDQLELLLQMPFTAANPSVNEWQVNVDQLIADYLKNHQLTMPAATSRQKRELISLLYGKKLFDFKEASAYIAAKMEMSRASIYNYLKTISALQQVEIHQVDAFTDKKFGGNPAGVVLDAEGLDETEMRKITRELNLSETSFVLPSKKGDFQLRYFTPTGHEILFCGHSTVGALYMIAQEKRFGIQGAGNYSFNVETGCGMLKMEAAIDDQEHIRVAYEAPEIRLRPAKMTHEEVAKAAGIPVDLLDPSLPVMYEETNKDLFISVRSLKDLKEVECDPKSFAQFSKRHDIVALCVVAPEAFDTKNQLHMRCFAPLVGVSEDPFTGSVLGGLTAYADSNGLLPKGAQSFRVEQGHFIERPGVVKVEFSKKKGAYHAKVSAQAVHCFSTEINLK